TEQAYAALQQPSSNGLRSLCVLGTEGLLHRMQIEDHALLFYTGLFFPQARSIVGLESMLQDYFNVPVEGISFVGQWHRLPSDEYSTVGLGGQNQQIGNAVLGTRMWDQQGKIDVKLGPLTFQEFSNFLPIGWGFMPMHELTRFYIGHELDFDIRLVLKQEEVPECKLDSKSGSRLGWTSWLKTKEFEQPGQVWINPKFFTDNADSARIPLFSSLPQDKLDEVMSQMTIHNFPAHTTVMKQGDASDSIFIIKVGEVQIFSEDLEGKQTVRATLGPDDFFGEYAFLTGKSRIATVVTLTDSRILELSKDELIALIEEYPRVGQAIETFSQRWRNPGNSGASKRNQAQ
ncbi:MAG: type VI secretion system baseplate subunit TssG, partial [Pseudomonadota bacterium]